MLAYLEAMLSAVPFGLIVIAMFTAAWAATKLFPPFGEYMNRPDEPKLTEADYEEMYRRTGSFNPRHW